MQHAPVEVLPRVLVAEDDPAVQELICTVLRRAGMVVDSTGDGLRALELVESSRPDLLLLDLDLDGLDGLSVMEALAGRNLPVIILTGRRSEGDRVLGLELGADDYVVKPFSPRELTARIRAVLRRAAPPEQVDLLDAGGGLEVDLAAYEARLDGEPLTLTRREFEVLAFLVRSPGRAFTREEMLAEVWGSSAEWQDPSTVTEHIRRLRLKMGESGHRLETVRGVGYRFS
ncbi:MAG TPA: response regulator transcription factor [Acidimicrobiales bacterium]|nr:response regulator transcription factor [Acidimicrobiales bacterium]